MGIQELRNASGHVLSASVTGQELMAAEKSSPGARAQRERRVRHPARLTYQKAATVIASIAPVMAGQ